VLWWHELPTLIHAFPAHAASLVGGCACQRGISNQLAGCCTLPAITCHLETFKKWFNLVP